MPRSKRFRPGDVLSIKLNDGTFAFARVLKRPFMAFYNLNLDFVPSVDEIIGKEILFRIAVMSYVYKEENWSSIGNYDLTDDLKREPKLFKQDSITGELFIYYPEQELEVPCTRVEVAGLENAAVWDPHHVEDRLLDYFNGLPNKWLEMLQPR